MDIGTFTHHSNTARDDYVENEPLLEELENFGLLEIKIGDVGNERYPYPEYNVHWKATELGEEAYNFVIEVVIDQLIWASQGD